MSEILYTFAVEMQTANNDADSFSGNQLKMLIKRLAKDMAFDMEEMVVSNVTSKGSRFYKAVYQYRTLVGLTSSTVKTGQLLIEINTYALNEIFLYFCGAYIGGFFSLTP